MGKQINQLTTGIALSGSDIFEFEQFYSSKWNSHKLTLTDLSTYFGVLTNPPLTTVLASGNSTFGYSILVNTGDKIRFGTGAVGELFYDNSGASVTLNNTTSSDYLNFYDAGTFKLKSPVGAISSDGIGNAVQLDWNESGNQMQFFNLNGQVGVYTGNALLYHDTSVQLTAPTINYGIPTSIHNFSGSSITASRVATFDGSSNLVSSSVTLIELGYLSGAASNLQNQINNINSGLSWKVAARVMSTSNVTIASPGVSVDGVTMAVNDRFVANGQSTGPENGVYVWNGAAVPATRSTDCSTGGAGSTGVLGMAITIEEGTYADQMWICSTNAPITVGVTALSFIKGSNTTYTGSNGITLTGNNFTLDNSYFTGDVISSAGVLSIGASKVTNVMLVNSAITVNGASTALGSSVTITTTGTANRISITGGTGLTPTVDISSSYVGQASITTLGTITTGVWNGTAIANANLANSSTTINGTSISLGASGTITANVTNALTVDNSSLQLNSGTTFDGSAARTISVKAGGVTNAMLAGSIDLISKVTGILPPANGGTGIANNSASTLTISGNFGTTFTVSATTTLTLPTSGIVYSDKAASITSASLLAAMSNPTGTGLSVFGTSPTFTTDITAPKIIGGTGATSVIDYMGSSNASVTLTAAAHEWWVGNSGATTAGRIYHNGNINLGNAATGNQRIFQVGQDTAFLSIGSITTSGSSLGVYANQTTPSGSNYSFNLTSANTAINAPTTTLNLQVGSNTRNAITTNTHVLSVGATTGGTVNFSWTAANSTVVTASTAVPKFLFTLGTAQWSTGSLAATEKFINITQPGISFVGASTATLAATMGISGAVDSSTNAVITTSVGLLIESAAVNSVGTVATSYGALFNAQTGATNNFALGLIGSLHLSVAGNGILIKEGSNATMGVATLVAGTVTVSTTKVTANSRIFLEVQSLGTVAVATPVAITARSAGTSFTISSSSLTDTSVIAWMIVEPG